MKRKFKVKKDINFREYMALYGYKTLISLFVSLIFFLIYIYLKEFVFIEYINALTYIVFFNIFIAGLSFCTNLGFFDIFAYNFLRTRNYLNKYRDENISRLNGTYDYTKSKEFKRKSNKFVPFTYLFVSLLFLIPLIILYIIYRVNIVWHFLNHR